MAMQRFISSRFGVGLGFFLGRLLPPQLAYRLARSAAPIFVRRRSSIVQAVMQNQNVVRGGGLSTAQMAQAAEEVFTHAARCFIDLYQNLKYPEKMKALVAYDAAAEKLIEYSNDTGFGAFVVAPHLSNFDLCLLAMAYYGLKAQVLSYGQPRGGYQIQNRIRAQTGLDITPVDENTENQAIENMINGGLVITAVDRPVRKKAHMLYFFDRPSPLPAGHIRMAIAAKVPVIVASASMDSESGQYSVTLSEPIPMERHPDPKMEIKQNAEAVLSVIEERIRKHPGQWLMYYPVWSGEEIG